MARPLSSCLPLLLERPSFLLLLFGDFTLSWYPCAGLKDLVRCVCGGSLGAELECGFQSLGCDRWPDFVSFAQNPSQGAAFRLDSPVWTGQRWVL